MNVREDTSQRPTRILYNNGVKITRRKHSKSKVGCPQCRLRKVKCDESLPACKKCLNRKVKCGYLDYSTRQLDLVRLAKWEANGSDPNTIPIKAQEIIPQRKIDIEFNDSDSDNHSNKSYFSLSDNHNSNSSSPSNNCENQHIFQKTNFKLPLIKHIIKKPELDLNQYPSSFNETLATFTARLFIKNLLIERIIIPAFTNNISFYGCLLFGYAPFIRKYQQFESSFLTHRGYCIEYLVTAINDLNDNNAEIILYTSVALDLTTVFLKDKIDYKHHFKFSIGPLSLLREVYKSPQNFPKSFKTFKSHADAILYTSKYVWVPQYNTEIFDEFYNIMNEFGEKYIKNRNNNDDDKNNNNNDNGKNNNNNDNNDDDDNNDNDKNNDDDNNNNNDDNDNNNDKNDDNDAATNTTTTNTTTTNTTTTNTTDNNNTTTTNNNNDDTNDANDRMSSQFDDMMHFLKFCIDLFKNYKSNDLLVRYPINKLYELFQLWFSIFPSECFTLSSKTEKIHKVFYVLWFTLLKILESVIISCRYIFSFFLDGFYLIYPFKRTLIDSGLENDDQLRYYFNYACRIIPFFDRRMVYVLRNSKMNEPIPAFLSLKDRLKARPLDIHEKCITSFRDTVIKKINYPMDSIEFSSGLFNELPSSSSSSLPPSLSTTTKMNSQNNQDSLNDLFKQTQIDEDKLKNQVDLIGNINRDTSLLKNDFDPRFTDSIFESQVMFHDADIVFIDRYIEDKKLIHEL